MLAQVQSVLDGLASAAVNLTNANGAGRAFELLLMTRIAGGLQARGYSVHLLRSDGVKQLPGGSNITFVQRGGAPSGVRPASAGGGGPTSIVFQKRPELPEWEIWNGVEFVGRSGATHEFDLAIVPKGLGDALRVTGGRPFGHGWLSIECKDVAKDGSPDEMRTFLARIYDTTLLNWHERYFGGANLRRIHPLAPTEPGFGSTSSSYRIENMNTYHALARRTGFTQGTLPMSDYYFIRRFEDIAVSSTSLNAFGTELCDWIDLRLPAHL
jgi:hypothetical protein